MWRGYPSYIESRWTDPVYWTPRWYDSNIHNLIDLDLPELQTMSAGTFTAPVASGGYDYTPAGWVLTEWTPATGNLFQSLFELFTHEKSLIMPSLHSVSMAKSLAFNVGDPCFAWVAYYATPIESLSIVISGSTIEIPKATSELDLLYSGVWKWAQEGSTVIIYGLDIQEQAYTIDASGAVFVNSSAKWSAASMHYVEHPYTRNWIPTTDIRSDGFINFFTDANHFRIRSHYVGAATALTTIQVIADEETIIATRVNLINTLDEKGEWVQIPRRDGESNQEYSDILLLGSWFRGSTIRGMRSFISTALRQSSYSSVSTSSSSFSFPASSTGFQIKNLPKYSYITEYLSPSLLTRVPSADYGQAFVDGIPEDYTVASGLVSVHDTSDVSEVVIRWAAPLYTETSSSVTFTENYDYAEDKIVLFAQNVDVAAASLSTRIKSYDRTSPSLRWQSSDIENEEPFGLAIFDF